MTAAPTAIGRRRWPPPAPDKPRWHARPELDLAPTEVRQVLVVAAAPRVASNFFDAALTATGRAGCAEEYAAPGELVQSHRRSGEPRLALRGRVARTRARLRGEAQWEHFGGFRADAVADYFRSLARRRATPNGVFAIKVFPPHLTGVLEAYGLDVDLWGVPVRWVRLRRRDRLAQAVSMSIAGQSGQWRPDGTASGDPVLDVDRVAGLMAWFEELDRQWDVRLAARDEPVLEVFTEDVTDDPAPAVRATLALLGEEAPVEVAPSVDAERFRSSTATLREQWVATVEAERPDLAARRWAVPR